ncbi:VOC family protein [Cellulomonas sp. Marseille-Q8402]
MTESTAPATGAHTTDGVPHGRTSLTPHLVVHPAERAIAFYEEVFGARVLDVTRMGGDEGPVGEAALDLGNGCLTLGDPLEAYGVVAPDPARSTYSLALHVPDVDAVVERAVRAGATLREPVTTFVSGDRYGSLVDPFGVRWTVLTRVVDLSREESTRRVAEWAAAQG